MISIAAAITLTELSKRTLWRRISDGSLIRLDDNAINDKAKISLESIKSYICVHLEPEDFELIERADAGNAEAQTDLALIFLSHEKPESAVYWLKMAIKQDNLEAMHRLGHCYIDGYGLPKDDYLGIMWIAKAASQGHVIAQAQIQAMVGKFIESGVST